MESFLAIYLSRIIFGITAAYYAKRSRKNPYLWFALGFLFRQWVVLLLFFPILIGIFLRFLIRKRLLRTGAFAGKNPPSPIEETTIDISPYPDLTVPPGAEKRLWYYLDTEGNTMGPMSFSLLYRNRKNGLITPDTLVWNEELSDWTRFQTIFY